MNISLRPGKYVVAVSGGVDSMSLLHALQTMPGVELVVAHFDHGIRNDSPQDAALVASVAKKLGLTYEMEQGKLGPDASEAEARKARYTFLRNTQAKHGAQAIIMAHHQDDVLETAILNLLRGTGRKGLSSLNSRDDIVRPLLHIPKESIYAYARQHNLQWREDSTNTSDYYARNYIRQYILPRFSPEHKATLLEIISKNRETNHALDALVAQLLKQQDAASLDRHTFIMLPHAVAREVMASWLRSQQLREFDKITIERLVTAAKTGKPRSRVNVYGPHVLLIDKHKLALAVLDR